MSIYKIHVFLLNAFKLNTMDLIVIYGQDVFSPTVTLQRGFERDINFSVIAGLFILTGSFQETAR